MKKLIYFLFGIFFSAILALWTFSKSEPDSLGLNVVVHPDSLLYIKVLKGLQDYQSHQLYKSEWTISADPSTGIIETNWYPTHKGEIRLKIQIAVWDKSYRIDVWQRIQLILFSQVVKTDWARRVEYNLQTSIESLK